jgi:hypothetical protein
MMLCIVYVVVWPERQQANVIHAADHIWRMPPHLEGSFPDTGPGVVPAQNLGIHRKYHK